MVAAPDRKRSIVGFTSRMKDDRERLMVQVSRVDRERASLYKSWGKIATKRERERERERRSCGDRLG
jgi:hypothetical protein